jgi:hypothetical protein
VTDSLRPVMDPADGPRPTALSLLAPAIVYTAFIFVMGSVPGGPPGPGVSDKVQHLVAFGLMVLPIRRALRFFVPGWSAPRRVWTSAVGASAVGALLELWQSLLSYRSAELLDWVADTLGALLVAGLLAMLLPGTARKS